MENEIWKVRSEKIGSAEPFKSEYDMESFLMNNPAIIGCWNPDVEAFPTLIRQQLYSKKRKGTGARIDLAGINITEKGYELRIFELKPKKIDSKAVEQLKDYLDGWRNENSAKDKINNWILTDIELSGVNESNISKIVDKPAGVLIGSEFDPDAIIKAREYNFKGIRLTRFKSDVTSEYYVIIEDVIGDIIQRAKRQQYDWNDFIDKGLIKPDDIFCLINPKKRIEVSAKPDYKSFGTRSMKLIFEDASVKKISEKEKDILQNAIKEKWYNQAQQSIGYIKTNEGIIITNATRIIHLAFGWPGAFWVPDQYWVHKATRKKINQLKSDL